LLVFDYGGGVLGFVHPFTGVVKAA